MINSIEELEKLLKLCRKQGVTELTLDGVAFKLGDAPRKNQSYAVDEPSHELTDEQMIFAAVDGFPTN